MQHFRAETSILVLVRLSEHAAHEDIYVQGSGVVMRDLHGKLSQASWKADGPIGTMRLSAGLGMPDRENVFCMYVPYVARTAQHASGSVFSSARCMCSPRRVPCSFLWSLSYPAV